MQCGKISKKGVFNMSKRNTNIGNSLNIVKDKIRYYRELNNYSYQGLSDKLMLHGIDIHKQEIYKIETGKRTLVDYELCGFAKVFNVKLEDLVSDFIDNI
jgi:transcriptional regulator with XRE-family HTH domain